ncbi:MAG TPA: MarR family transcriptional regulator [Gaiella sp.]|jgi:DNA-binding MarR family transcriptional regulator|nr:MarR family transcriptional regulator [Gaiella sp.]
MESVRTGAKPFGPPLIGALLRTPWEAVQRHMLQRLHERGFDDVDAAYLTIFRYPGPQGARPTDLARRLGLSKQALNYLLRELERLGYLEREPHPDDLRSKRIVLTKRGVAAGGVIREAVAEVEVAWEEQLGPERFAELRDLLLELNRIV